MNGLAPLSMPSIDAWCRLYGIELAPHEVSALIQIDSVMRNPDPEGP